VDIKGEKGKTLMEERVVHQGATSGGNRGKKGKGGGSKNLSFESGGKTIES